MRNLEDRNPKCEVVRRLRLRAFPALLALPLLALTLVQAFPPAPHHLLFGQVRDEWGRALDVEDAEVLMETANGKLLRVPIYRESERGVNYLLRVPMDAGMTSELHKPTAMRPEMPFRIRVRVGRELLLPIELAATDSGNIGRPGYKTRLNLTLGEDADGDGLPDAWERQLLSEMSDLEEVNPDDDADGDGLSNLQEYLSGNYAYDGEHELSLEIVGFQDGVPTMEFLAVAGRSYEVLGSVDLQDWDEVSFQLDGTNEAGESSLVKHYSADDVRPVRIVVPQDAEGEGSSYRFFKLRVH